MTLPCSRISKRSSSCHGLGHIETLYVVRLILSFVSLAGKNTYESGRSSIRNRRFERLELGRRDNAGHVESVARTTAHWLISGHPNAGSIRNGNHPPAISQGTAQDSLGRNQPILGARLDVIWTIYTCSPLPYCPSPTFFALVSISCLHCRCKQEELHGTRLCSLQVVILT
ncbi:uncharacterized protein BCR38DRAFT_93742 [Pseudomassariella vexata]|uniref:Uncharacterized protein n=1 Tax=Pseudomassariella vexata TaxID=1141098 RepID=A0A1Y2EE37_9PEZI|nr:uncharacterized protein BCR38DRAFT_93742 [Pseudomassariella vexata]ORY69832.1 hypothetical protein BCR38DRAFT_93742 [Pseudomassariella vexata]